METQGEENVVRLKDLIDSESMPIQEILSLMDCHQEKDQIKGFIELNSYPKKVIIDLVIGHLIIPRCLQVLRNATKLKLKILAAHTLSTLAAGTQQHVLTLLSYKDVMVELVNMLNSNALRLILKAARMLGNIAKSSAMARHIFFQHSVADVVLRVMSKDPDDVIQIYLSELVLRLVRYSRESIALHQQFNTFLMIIVSMIDSRIGSVIRDACLALDEIIVANADLLDAFIALDGAKRLVRVLSRNRFSLRSTLDIMTVIAKQKAKYANAILDAGAVNWLCYLLRTQLPNEGIKILELLSCLIFTTEKAVRIAMDAGVYHIMPEIIRNVNPIYYASAIDIVATTIFMATKQQILEIADRYEIFKPFMLLLMRISCVKSQTTVITALNHLFDVDASLVSLRPPLLEMYLGKLLELCMAEDDELSARARTAIENYAKYFLPQLKQ
ncbi:importin subunit alpha-like [Drosophila albomicans]|uniref:Importin subunit alpha-like n=1 Tax=Drosophila albomicans TaxID=7291 RepID=A0A6P8Y002_DROAB|nr:importin subunit alpha-like [Drosophila albomicans]